MAEMILDILVVIGAYVVKNAGAIATLAGVAIAIYGLESWKREYRFKRNSELLEEALFLFYEADRAIKYLRNPGILTSELIDFKFPPELEQDYCKARYEYKATVERRFDEKKDIFDRLNAIELRVRARFGERAIAPFVTMKEKVRELLVAANQYSLKDLPRDQLSQIERKIWNLPEEKDDFGDEVHNIVEHFDRFSREKLQS